MKFDLHFHTTFSDGSKTPAEVVAIAREKKLDFLACTEHDLVNTVFPGLAKDAGIETVQWVELSSSDYGNSSKSAHLTCYSREFQGRITGILEDVRRVRGVKIERQVDQLQKNGFYIDRESFFAYWEKFGASSENLNNGHIREYLFLDPRNEAVVREISGEAYDRPTFINRFLAKKGDFAHIGAIDNLAPYEPSVELCGELARENNAVLSIAHPNHTFKSIEEFRLLTPRYVERGVSAIEMHYSTPPAWTEVILETQRRYGLLLTFGSDCHFDSHGYKHGMIGDLNPHLSEEFIQGEFQNFREVL